MSIQIQWKLDRRGRFETSFVVLCDLVAPLALDIS